MQIITIVEDNRVTGVVYGTVEIHDEKIIKQKNLTTFKKLKNQIRQIQHKTNIRHK